MTSISFDSLPAPTASYEASPDEVNRVVLLYSGGLDTSVMLHWIQAAYKAEVVTLTINVGQPGEDYDALRDKARSMGAAEAIVIDAREEFAEDFVLPAIKANALYGGGYPLFTSLARPLIGKIGVEIASQYDCDTLAHGCTGKGNDQVRLDGAVTTLNPDLKIIAPVRSWQIGREEELAYCRENGIPLKGTTTSAPPYSIDDNLWGRSSEGGGIEDLANRPPDDVFQLVTRPEEAPDEPEYVKIGFEAGRPVSFNGEKMDLVPLLELAAEAGMRHGCGIVDHIEDRIVGLKVRDLYEVPAAALVLTAHQDLEKVVSTIHQNNFKHSLDRHWAYIVYAGLWYEPLRENLDAFMTSANEAVTGEIELKLYKGSVTPVSRRSPYALYDENLASFGESGGDFSQNAAPGFIELFSLQSRMAHQIRRQRD